MIQIQSSLICMNVLNLNKQLEILLNSNTDKIQFNHIHVDVMDHCFVPRYGIYPQIVRNIKEQYPSFKFHTHLMTDNPINAINAFADVSDSMYVHLSSTKHISYIMETIKNKGIESGIVLDKLDDPESLNWLDKQVVDNIMLMGINPGVLTNIDYTDILFYKTYVARKKCNGKISIDGGVSSKSIKELIKNGATNLVCGTSTLYNKIDLETNIKKIKELI